MKRALELTALAVAFCAFTAANAAQGEDRALSPAVKVSRQLVEQKEIFLKRLLSDSPAAKRIEASKNREAAKYLTGAQQSYGKAVLSIKNDDIAAADRQLNEAIALIGKARRLAPDPLARNVEHQVRYAQLLEAVESLRISYQRHLQRGHQTPPGVAAGDAQLNNVTQLIDRAKSLASGDQISEANKVLGEAERTLMVSLGRVLGTRTVEYSQQFKTPAEEYAYELERNGSYADLIPLAIAEFKPGRDATRDIENLVNTNRRLREQAQQHASNLNHRAALVAVRDGTANLQNALAKAGLRVPQELRPDRVRR